MLLYEHVGPLPAKVVPGESQYLERFNMMDPSIPQSDNAVTREIQRCKRPTRAKVLPVTACDFVAVQP